MLPKDDSRVDAGDFALLDDPRQALAWRLALIRTARHAIDAQYYSWEEDGSGKLLLAELLLAARRGVKVRLLLDDLYAGEARFLPILARQENFEVRLFNPFHFRLWRPLGFALEVLLRFRRLNHRMHNKLLLVDGREAIMGGRNIGDSYFDLGQSPNFVDLDLLCRGPICCQLERGFVRFWRSRWSRPLLHLHPEAPRDGLARLGFLLGYPEVAHLYGIPANLVAQTPIWYGGTGSALFDAPGKGLGRRGRIARLIWLAIRSAGSELTLVSPYLVLTPRFMGRLRRLARRGTRVQVLTNSLATTDVPLVQGTYERQRARLRRVGVRVCELKPGEGRSLHAKLVLGSEGRILLGSFNLDPRSLFLNTEIALRLDCPGLVTPLRAWLRHWQLNSWEGEAPDYQPLSWWRLIWRWLSGRLPIQRWL